MHKASRDGHPASSERHCQHSPAGNMSLRSQPFSPPNPGYHSADSAGHACGVLSHHSCIAHEAADPESLCQVGASVKNQPRGWVTVGATLVRYRTQTRKQLLLREQFMTSFPNSFQVFFRMLTWKTEACLELFLERGEGGLSLFARTLLPYSTHAPACKQAMVFPCCA